jgi:hypothetical protein
MTDWKDADPDEESFAREIAEPLVALRARGNKCPKPDLLLAGRAGVLPPEMASDVARHLGDCGLCQVLLDSLVAELPGPSHEAEHRIRDRVFAGLGSPPVDALSGLTLEEERRIRERVFAGLDAGPGRGHPERRRAWSLVWRPVPLLATLAVLAAAVAGTLWVYLDRPVTPAEVAGAPQTDAPEPPAPPPTEHVLVLEKPPVRLPVAAALVWRGGGDDQQQHLEALGRALAAYGEDDFRSAAGALGVIAETRPTVEVLFYLGVSNLFLDRHGDALTALEKVRQMAQPPLDEDAAWYLAVAYERLGRQEDAASQLRGICNGDGSRRAQACDALERMQITGR